MVVLITGVAGFIGFHAAKELLSRGITVIGLDVLNHYYDVRLKEARLKQLVHNAHFSFYKVDIADRKSMETLIQNHSKITHVLHLAAQAGVRYSLTHPHEYGHSNLIGHLTMLEAASKLPHLHHFVYASSSSVYGANENLPFSTEDRTESPISLYAATKKSCELMSYSYSHTHKIPTTGLRYFTVYGPWGRPDMAAFLFTKAIIEEKDMPVYNHGKMKRNFTYIDDAVRATMFCLFSPPSSPLFQLYNIGNSRAEELMDFIATLEKQLGQKARIRFEEMAMGDVPETIAEISPLRDKFGFVPQTNIEEGLSRFVSWYRKTYAAMSQSAN